MFLDLLEPMLNKIAGCEMVLQIGRRKAGRGFDKSARFSHVGGQRTSLESQIAGQTRKTLSAGESDGPHAFVCDWHRRMVL